MGGIVLFFSVLWGKIPAGIKFAAIGLVAGAALLAGIYLYGVHNGRQQAAVSAVKAVAQAYKDRSHENATVDALDAYDLCLRLGGGVPDCKPLMRGLAEDHAPADDSGISGRP